MTMDNCITIPIDMKLSVWGRKVDHINACIDDPAREDDDAFWGGEFRRQLAAAVKLLGESNKYESLIASIGAGDSEIVLDYLSALTINFIGGEVWYDYIFESGRFVGNFDVHLKGTPDGRLEFVEMT